MDICPLSSRGRELSREGERRSPLSFEERGAFGAEGGVGRVCFRMGAVYLQGHGVVDTRCHMGGPLAERGH